uniref:C2 domain-containing protein n=3 Tax=Dunaliella tertiolecta TaxID=3047 RepID=A0A6S8NBT6_DUNTE|mmetsp:Transcript_20672/g.57682  ORF Transcript_20672/g.57682 Transcript_20672/m.57682 type:complete len:653 (-) Transcript_20672:874-2832(-)|eukprot:CAMPEP_0202349098 /NCGR_PEP_ID=MMETSP1126-20121109/6735_1 /ASSEMBLY_ACC=CAM_ASM_000457 /TAXON_ID=3047 /ORGANISM="Dunaliella tertiolecta, Strain CCMP1320" /LENGTH=652 /DNA_ID=CAMNT_0048940859 /DNA_START=254 /DNA_END=2212 /DNA_ORIENTATION=+
MAVAWVLHMGLTICFGTILGVLLGVTIGSLLFSLWAKQPEDYRRVLDVSADEDDEVVPPSQGTPISAEMRKLLPYTASWTHWPDSEKVSGINRILSILWPHITKAGIRMGLDIGKQIVQPMLEKKQIPFVEDIALGTKSMADEQVYQPAAEWIKRKDFTLGKFPLQLGGIKSYDTPDDEVVLETPIMWGSDAKLDIGVFLKFGLLRLYVPLEVSNVQIKVDTRITVKPLVETIPCVGGVTISLLKVPLVDMNLKSFFGMDILSLPGARLGLNWALQKFVYDPFKLLYPSSFSTSIMEDYGVPPVPKGALEVVLMRGENLLGDHTYVRLKTRGENCQESNTVHGSFSPNYLDKNPQKFTLIVEDFEKQQLGLEVVQNRDDNDFTEPTLGIGTLPFGKHEPAGQDPVTNELKTIFVLAKFIRVPMKSVNVKVPLEKPVHPRKLEIEQKKKKHDGILQSFSQSRHRPEQADAGSLFLSVKFLPFSQPVFDDEEDPASQETDMLPTRRLVIHDPPDDLPGVLTVHVIRCINLKGDRPTTYVDVLLKQEDLKEKEGKKYQLQKTQKVTGENNPRFGRKFDFVMIRADSTLFFTVHQKDGEQPKSMFKKRKDAMLGYLELPVKDVAKNGMLKDTWLLKDTERGRIELQLKWQTCYIDD